jgi:ketosteroid isomerase-like protein
MSQGDVDLVLAFHAAYNAREVGAAVELCAIDVKVSPDVSRFPEASPFVGNEALENFLEETWLAWSSGSVRPEEVLDVEDGRVLVRAQWSGTGGTSGVEMSMSLSGIYTIQDSRISSIRWYFDHDDALKAVGLADG